MENIKIKRITFGEVPPEVVESYKEYLLSVRSFKRLNRPNRLNKVNMFVSALLKRSHIIVSVDSENDNLVYSYVFYYRRDNSLTINYVYTIPTFRGFGIAKHMLSKLEQDCHSLLHTIPTSKLAAHSIWKKYKLRKSII